MGIWHYTEKGELPEIIEPDDSKFHMYKYSERILFHLNKHFIEQNDYENEYYTGKYGIVLYHRLNGEIYIEREYFQNDDYEQNMTDGEYEISDVDKWAYISDIERLLDSAEQGG